MENKQIEVNRYKKEKREKERGKRDKSIDRKRKEVLGDNRGKK